MVPLPVSLWNGARVAQVDHSPLHLLRSKLARWPLAITIHATPLASTSSPRGPKPCEDALGLFQGSSYISASAVSGGCVPGFSRTTAPGKPRTVPQIEPSFGLTL